jgi:putative DNA primase/helicase
MPEPQNFFERAPRSRKKVRSSRRASPNGHDDAANDDLITEGRVSDAFTAAHRDELRFDHTAGRWFAWNGTRWRREETKLAYRYAHDLATLLAASGKDAVRVQAGKAAFAAGVERLAQSDRAFAVNHEHWDRDPWVVGTPGGVVSLTDPHTPMIS